MKKAISLLAVFLVAVMWSAPGFSADKYVSGNIGISWLSDTAARYSDNDNAGYNVDMGSGITLLGALGCDYGDYRAEGELGYQNGDISAYNVFCDNGQCPSEDISGDVSILSLMMNGYYDIDLGGGVELSPTVGVGIAQVKAVKNGDDSGFSLSETTFAYQAGVGLGIPVADNIMLDARYRYFATTDFTFEAGGTGPQFNADMESHSALLGMRVMF
ncbi:MAG: porin [Prosthecochloris sp.]|nr:porin [Prosthecochloris sp.]